MRTPSHSSRRYRGLLAIPAALALGLAGPAGVAAGSTAAAPCYVRLAHFSPDTPNVDVYVTAFSRPNWRVVLRGVGYGAVSPYQRVQPDVYTVSMRPAGAAPTSPPVISTTVRGAPAAAFTVAGVGSFADLGLTVLRDDLAMPPRGQARARVVQASARAGTVAVEATDGPSITRSVDFAGTTPYATVPAGRLTLRVRATDGDAAPVTQSVDLTAGTVYSLLVLDAGGGGVRLVTTADAVAAAVTPKGAVETGAGGTADRPDRGLSPAAVSIAVSIALGAAAAVLLGLLAARRWTRVDRPAAG